MCRHSCTNMTRVCTSGNKKKSYSIGYLSLITTTYLAVRADHGTTTAAADHGTEQIDQATFAHILCWWAVAQRQLQ
jgi:hypothetical protein